MMDGVRFDHWARKLTRSPHRRQVLAASAASLAGLWITGELGTARKKQHRKKNAKKVQVCQCASDDPATCTTTKVKKQNVFIFVIEQPCSYKGLCLSGVTMCPVF